MLLALVATMTVTATPAEVRDDPAAVFEVAINRHYSAMSDGEPCQGCAQTIVRERRIRGARVQLRKATTEYGDVYGIVFTAGSDDRWAAADPLDDVQPDSCGMGKCVSETMRSIDIVRDHDALWVSLRIDVRIDHLDPKSHSTHPRDVVIGCTLGRDPSCATVTAGRAFTEGRARRRGTRLHVVEGDEVSDVDVVF